MGSEHLYSSDGRTEEAKISGDYASAPLLLLFADFHLVPLSA